jgi:heme oxygenase
MWGFYAALEIRLYCDLFDGALGDYETRRKLPLLTEDLITLGYDPVAVHSLPLCEALPDCGDSAAAFGCLYVMEGATLGGRVILPLVERQLDCSATRGATFLASYGGQVEEMWRRFCAALDASCRVADRRERAAAAAVSTFVALERWLCGENTVAHCGRSH